jgi:hypothetical protein
VAAMISGRKRMAFLMHTMNLLTQANLTFEQKQRVRVLTLLALALLAGIAAVIYKCFPQARVKIAVGLMIAGFLLFLPPILVLTGFLPDCGDKYLWLFVTMFIGGPATGMLDLILLRFSIPLRKTDRAS